MSSIKVHITINQEEYPELYALVTSCKTGRLAGRKLKNAAQAWLTSGRMDIPSQPPVQPVRTGESVSNRTGANAKPLAPAASEERSQNEEFGDSVIDDLMK